MHKKKNEPLTLKSTYIVIGLTITRHNINYSLLPPKQSLEFKIHISTIKIQAKIVTWIQSPYEPPLNFNLKYSLEFNHHMNNH
jgi:hypothetical protein